MSDEYEEPKEPVVGETRLKQVKRNGKTSVEVEVYTGKGWISFNEMLGLTEDNKDDQP